MTINSEILIQDLLQRTIKNKLQVEKYQRIPFNTLNWKFSSGQWSILECLEHLNLYGDFYLPEIEKRLYNSKHNTPSLMFKSGFLGNYFALSMLPGANMLKMKTFKNKDPIGVELDKETLDRFIHQQQEMERLLNLSKNVDLNRTKTSTTLSRLIKLKVGDTFRVVVYHTERHLEQANRVLQLNMSSRDQT